MTDKETIQDLEKKLVSLEKYIVHMQAEMQVLRSQSRPQRP